MLFFVQSFLDDLSGRFFLLPTEPGPKEIWKTVKNMTAKMRNHGYVMYLGGGSHIFFFYPYLGKIPILTNIFQVG